MCHFACRSIIIATIAIIVTITYVDVAAAAAVFLCIVE